MDDNLQQSYHQVVLAIREYRAFLDHMWSRVGRLTRRHTRKHRRPHFDPLEPWWSVPLVHAGTEIMQVVATEDDKKNELFAIIQSPYRLDALSRYLERRFPDVDFRGVAGVHAIQQKRIERFPSVARMLGLVVAGGVFLLSQIPQVVMAKYFDAPRFQEMVFWTMTASMAYIAVDFGIVWWKQRRTRRESDRIARVLDYTVLRLDATERHRRGEPAPEG